MGVKNLHPGPNGELAEVYMNSRATGWVAHATHEFAHVVRHLSPDRQVILDDLDVASSEAIEAEADSFARNALIPPSTWKGINKDSSTEEVLEAAQKAGVHPAIAAGRWRFEHSDYRRFSKLIGRGKVKSALMPA